MAQMIVQKRKTSLAELFLIKSRKNKVNSYLINQLFNQDCKILPLLTFQKSNNTTFIDVATQKPLAFRRLSTAPKRPDRSKQCHCLQFAESASLASCITLRKNINYEL